MGNRRSDIKFNENTNNSTTHLYLGHNPYSRSLLKE